jgi:hypothetical protein
LTLFDKQGDESCRQPATDYVIGYVDPADEIFRTSGEIPRLFSNTGFSFGIDHGNFLTFS